MRIAHFFLGVGDPHRADGIERWIYHCTRYQAKLHQTVAVFGLENHAPASIPGVDARTYPRLRLPFALPRSLLRDLSAWRPDVIHLHSVYTPALTALEKWARFKGIAYVISAHGALNGGAIARGYYRKLVYKWLFQRPDMNHALFVHAVSPSEELRQFGVRAPIVVAQNGFEPDEIPRDLDSECLARRLPSVRGKRVFMFMGRMGVYQKGLDLLVRAWAQVRPENSVLVIVGPDWHDNQATLEALIQELGLTEQVLLAGPAYGEERYHLLAGADVFAHPSRWEGSSLAVLEAAAFGLPGLLTLPADLNTGVIAEHGGAIDAPLDVDGVASALRTFATMSKDELLRMGQKGAELVRREFGWDKTATTLVEAYQRYLSNRR